jgi:poly-gamma-glutamate system protein
MYRSAEIMQRATSTIAGYCATAGIVIDKTVDLNGTCLVGPEYAALFTSLGRLEAKRTTVNPNMAALVAHLLIEGGVSTGDTIAVGASGSFPGLLVATLAAAEALNTHAVTILSLGASSYGATRPDFNLLDIHQLLVEKGVLSSAPTAVSLGGEGDVGAEFDPDVREHLERRVHARGVPFLYQADVRGGVLERMAIYLNQAAGRHISAFVNVGGSDANIGQSPLVLQVEPGLHTGLSLPPEDQRGVLYEMVDRGIPVIHLLNVRDLALRYGFPWDPLPLPEPGSARLRRSNDRPDWRFWLILTVYLGCLCAIVLDGIRRTAVSG